MLLMFVDPQRPPRSAARSLSRLRGRVGVGALPGDDVRETPRSPHRNRHPITVLAIQHPLRVFARQRAGLVEGGEFVR